MLSSHFIMLQRNLLYTAVTRARKLLVLIGGKTAVSGAVRNTRLSPRWSLLPERFREL